MECYYCGEPADYHLDEIENEEAIPRKACYHCLQLLKPVEQDHRKAYLIHALQLHHSTAMKMAESSEYRSYWLAKLADRISWAQVGYKQRAGWTDQRVRSLVIPQAMESDTPEVPAKSITPKPIKIKKLG